MIKYIEKNLLTFLFIETNVRTILEIFESTDRARTNYSLNSILRLNNKVLVLISSIEFAISKMNFT